MQEYWLDPPDYDDPDYFDDSLELNFEEYVEVTDDEYEIVDRECKWVKPDNRFGYMYGDQTGAKVIRDDTVREHCEEMICSYLDKIPSLSTGLYKITGVVKFLFCVSAYRDVGSGREVGFYHPEYDFSEADSELVDESIKDVKIEKIR